MVALDAVREKVANSARESGVEDREELDVQAGNGELDRGRIGKEIDTATDLMTSDH